MFRLLFGLGVVVVILTVYAVVDCALFDRNRIRGVPRWAWILMIILLPVLGAALWLLIGSDRRNELSGNLSLYQELGFIEAIDRLLADGTLRPDRGYKHVTVRVIEMPRNVQSSYLGPASKLNRDPDFLRGLDRVKDQDQRIRDLEQELADFDKMDPPADDSAHPGTAGVDPKKTEPGEGDQPGRRDA